MKGEGGNGKAGRERPRVYQLMVRHFGNTNEARIVDGDLEENGCGKFADINDAALVSLGAMNFTHVWLTGVLEHASRTPSPGQPAEEAALVKGKAGSPYAIRDYFDVSADYAENPERRLVEFRQLLARCERHGLKTLIDFVPNHVARSYHSDLLPELDFGARDQRDVFFRRDNNFFYLGKEDPGGGPPLKLPGADGGEGGGVFAPETEFGRVTGNNVRSWSPSIHDWYETVKLNYGHDFTTGHDTGHLPGPEAPVEEVPDTWRKMDAVLDYWHRMGVSGYRADMAHMVPMEFWRWAIARARERDPGVFFVAEAYDGDEAKLTDGNVLEALLGSGFDAVYDSPTYQLVQQIYEGPKWGNDIDAVLPKGERFYASARYAENHDEVRLASPLRWGGLGMKVGKPVSSLLFGLGSGPVMVYNGQEVGEPATGRAGFSGEDGRTTLFDYWSLPELAKWVNGHCYDGGRLSQEQKKLRDWYGRLLQLCGEPAFTNGEFRPLNSANLTNPAGGRLGDEAPSGHWLYAYLRAEEEGGQVFLVVINLHGEQTLGGVKLIIPEEDLREIGCGAGELRFRDRLASDWSATTTAEALWKEGLALPDLPPCSAMYVEVGKRLG